MTDARDLYGLPLDRFVPERAALARALRAGDRRAPAEEVAKLRKPSVAAWAVNQLVRTQRQPVGELFEAGDGLQQAHADVVGGKGDATALREANERERAVVERLLDLARGLLSSQGHELSATTLERVRETLHAAALDPDARVQVADACLVRELRHVGLGEGGVARGRPRAARGRSPRARDGSKAAQRANAARKAAAAAKRAAERAANELRIAQDRQHRAAAALEDADTALAEARRHAEQTALALQEAEQALAELQR